MLSARVKLGAVALAILGLLLVVSTILFSGSSNSPTAIAQEKPGGGAPPSLVKIDRVIREEFGQTMPVIGRLVSRQSGPIAARIAGAVEAVLVEVGDQVEAGDVLVELVTNRLEWELKQREAELAQSEAELSIRRNELTRLKRLRNSAAFQQSRYNDVELEVANLEASVAGARASMELARLNLDYAKVRAPFSGTVTLRQTEAGAYVNIGTPVVTLVNDQSLEVEADVPGDRTGGLRPGTTVAIETGGMSFPATVRAVVADENPLTRTRAVRFTLPPGAGNNQLTPNQSVTVRLPIAASRPIVSIHKDAVIDRLGQNIAFVVKGDIVEMRTLQLGEAVGNRLEVLQGVSPGDDVVVRGNERLRAGQPVQIDGGV